MKFNKKLAARWDQLVMIECLAPEKMTKKEKAELKRLQKIRNPRTERERAYDKAIKKSFDKMMRAINEHIKIQKDFNNGK